MSKLRKVFVEESTALAVIVVLLLLALHTISASRFPVEGPTVALVGLLLVVPHLRWIRRLRFGDFEAEIAERDIREVERNVAATEPGAPEPDSAGIPRDTYSEPERFALSWSVSPITIQSSLWLS